MVRRPNCPPVSLPLEETRTKHLADGRLSDYSDYLLTQTEITIGIRVLPAPCYAQTCATVGAAHARRPAYDLMRPDAACPLASDPLL
eukprot:2228556-Pleurochrysis_carterae.AAC.1